MSIRTAGIHHVTGIASDPQRNLDFYGGVLGLRLVKRTVNFDDPTTYHFYFGDEQGNPGSILTFFPWPDARRGRQGGGQVAVTSFAILPSSVGFWIERLIRKQVEFAQPTARYEDERVIAFKDYDGFMGELVAHPAATAECPRNVHEPVVLAIGHSARDTFPMLHRRGVRMEAKPFSIGFRIEHPQSPIARPRLGPQAGNPTLGAADYTLVHPCRNGISVYTFCTCPGCTVVAAGIV